MAARHRGSAGAQGTSGLEALNVPVTLVAPVGVGAFQRESRAPYPPRLNLPGVALVTAALLLVLYPLGQARELGPAPVCDDLPNAALQTCASLAHSVRSSALAMSQCWGCVIP